MTVYVDPMAACVRSAKWPYDSACHMIADTEEELLRFAVRIGLRPDWIQHAGTYRAHFDLTAGKREQAVAMGAIEISMYQLGCMLSAHRPFSQSSFMGLDPAKEGADRTIKTREWRNER